MSRVTTLGPVGYNPTGNYDSMRQYEKLDVVLYQGSSYVALQTVQGQVPTNTEYWQKLVSGGVGVDDIVDNLDSNDGEKPLSAKQGNNLNKSKVEVFDTVALMKADNSLKTGMTAQTLGYYGVNDGGEATYKITNVESETDYQEELENGLYATLIINDVINVKQFGAKGDGENDDTQAIQSAINLIYNNISTNLKNNAFKTRNVVLIPEGIYLTKSTIDLPVVVRILTNGNPKILVDFDEGSGIYLNSRNLSHINYEDRNDFQNYISGNIIDSTSGSLTIEKKDSFYYQDTAITGSIGLEVGDKNYTTSDISAIARCNLNNVNISGFETGLALNYSNLYCVTFNNFVIQENYYNIYTTYNESSGNAGERITFKNCTLGIARYGLYIRWGLSGSLTFDNCSFDYMGCAIKAMYTVTGNINIIGGHIEGIGYENPQNNIRTRFPGVSKDWGYICYYDTSNPNYKLMLNISDTTFYLVDVGTSDNGKRFGSALAFTDLGNFNQLATAQQNLIVNLKDVNFEGMATGFNENRYKTKEIFLADSGVNINFSHTNSLNGFGLYSGYYYNDFVGRFVTTDDIARYYTHQSNIHSSLSFTKYNDNTKGTYDSTPYFTNALSVSTSENVTNMGISRITYPTSKHIRVCFIYKLNNVSVSNYTENVQIFLHGYSDTTALGNTQIVTTTQYIMKEPNNGWHIAIAEFDVNNYYDKLLITPRVYLKDSQSNNLEYTATLDIGALIVDYCD